MHITVLWTLISNDIMQGLIHDYPDTIKLWAYVMEYCACRLAISNSAVNNQDHARFGHLLFPIIAIYMLVLERLYIPKIMHSLCLHFL